MSTTATQTNAEVNYGFDAAAVAKKPTLACIGCVEEVGESKTTKDGEGLYDMIRIRLRGVQGSRGTVANFLFRPDWFNPSFKADDLLQYTDIDPEDGKPIGSKMLSVYRSNINAKGSSLSKLKGLCGSEENFAAFCKIRYEAYAALVAQNGGPTVKDEDGNDVPVEFTAAEIRDLLNAFLLSTGATIGYELVQGRQKVAGSSERELTDRYEIGEVKFYDDKQLKAWVSRANNAAKRAERAGTAPDFLIAFEQ